MAGGPAYFGGTKPKSRRRLWIGLAATVRGPVVWYAYSTLISRTGCSVSRAIKKKPVTIPNITR